MIHRRTTMVDLPLTLRVFIAHAHCRSRRNMLPHLVPIATYVISSVWSWMEHVECLVRPGVEETYPEGYG